MSRLADQHNIQMPRTVRQRTTGTVFYTPAAGIGEVHTGYLYKSPPSSQMKSLRSWKRRLFVLFKMSEDAHQLKYFKSEEKRDRPLGGIDLSQVSLMFLRPESHSMWGWIHDTFRCPAECVLYIKVAERDFFLIAENSWEADSWFGVLFNALKNRPHKLLNPEESRRIEFISEPPTKMSSSADQKAKWRPVDRQIQSAPLPPNMGQDPIYDYPRKSDTAQTLTQTQPQKGEEVDVEEDYDTSDYVTIGKVENEVTVDLVTKALEDLKTQMTSSLSDKLGQEPKEQR